MTSPEPLSGELAARVWRFIEQDTGCRGRCVTLGQIAALIAPREAGLREREAWEAEERP